jgi:Leucine-rich repeat (LRR) protein
MDHRVSQYQRAVTPTLETGAGLQANNNGLRGKILSYSNNANSNNPNLSSSLPSASSAHPRVRSIQLQNQANNGFRATSTSMSPRNHTSASSSSNPSSNLANEISMSGKSFSGFSSANAPLNMSGNGIATYGRNIPLASTSGKLTREGSSSGREGVVGNAGDSSSSSNMGGGGVDQYVMPRYDLIPLNEEIPADGIIFAKMKGQQSDAVSLVVYRTPEERLRNPERLNLDRRGLEICPILEQEQRLRLLNYQNNSIKQITNLENLPNLIFLDLYNNQIFTLDGPLCNIKGLRVLMAGKNKITKITNLEFLRKLDVLDLHSNEIKIVEGLEGLSDLRVLNLAGKC